jgi:small subunit ribosomal protein S6
MMQKRDDRADRGERGDRPDRGGDRFGGGERRPRRF